MTKSASSLSKENFKRVVSSDKNYVPTRIARELKSANMGRLLYGSKISKQQTLKALKHLREKGLLAKQGTLTEIYKEAAAKQYEQDLANIKTEQQKHIRANIMIDIADELADEEIGEKSLRYDHHSALGQKRIIDEIEEERLKREKQRKNEMTKQNELVNPRGAKPKKPDLVDLQNVPDLDID